MPVYVDATRHKFGRMVMCHMMADTTAELLAMVDRIGIDRRHIQDAGTEREHFDISKTRRELAVAYGAVEVHHRELGKLIQKRREAMRERNKT
jgi:hypothetical protein